MQELDLVRLRMAGKIGNESVKIAKTFWIIDGQLHDCSAAAKSKFMLVTNRNAGTNISFTAYDTFEGKIYSPEQPIW